MSIIIDPEFKALIPPLTSDEYTQLEKNILKDGIRDALIVWPQPDGNDILIDGHNRFDISAAHAGVRFDIRRIQFKSRDEAKQWIILNQFGRRNLSAYDRGVLALKLKPIIAEKAKEQQGARTDISQKSVKSHDTQKELATIAGVSHDTIHRVEAIEKKATPETKQLVRDGKMSINQAYNSVHPKRPDPVKQAKEEHADFTEKKKAGVVDIADARLDKVNRDIMNNALMEEFHKMLDAVDKFGLLHSRDDIRQLAQAVSKDTLGATIERCAATGKTLMLMLEIMEDTYERN